MKASSRKPVPHGSLEERMPTKKFMQTLDRTAYLKLTRTARKRGITLQQLLRAVVVPEWREARQKAKGPSMEFLAKKEHLEKHGTRTPRDRRDGKAEAE